jgi:predicted PurR-regulated permease PerM
VAQEPRAPDSGTRRGPGWYGVWLPRAAATTIVVAATWFGAIWVFSSSTGFLTLLLLSAFLGFALLPGVESLTRRGWSRGAATGVVMAVGAVVAVAFVVAMTTVVVGQVASLIDQLPQYIETATPWLRETLGVDLDTAALTSQLNSDQEMFRSIAGNALGGVLGVASTFAGLLFQALTVGLFVFYILADLPRLRAAINRRFPPQRQEYIDTITTITVEKVGGWTYSRGMLALSSAAFHLVVFMVLGLPYAVALALWVGVVSQFVPTVGTYLAGVVPLLIAVLERPIDALWVLVAIAVYQQIENYLIAPRITANTMDLHPAVGFASALVGASLLGGIGALLALPVAATITALVQTYGDHYEVIRSGTIENPEDYEARMQAEAEAKQASGSARGRRRHEREPPVTLT